MVRCWTFLQITLMGISIVNCDIGKDRRGRRKHDHGDKSLWKKEYETELTDAMLTARKRENNTRVQQAAFSDNEAVLERLMDSITASEKYLKKVDSIDFRLNRLDIEVHEKTNHIMKHLSDISKGLRSGDQHPDKSDTIMDGLKNDIYQIKYLLENNNRLINTGNCRKPFEPHAPVDSPVTFKKN